jgi:hypothetical protein
VIAPVDSPEKKPELMSDDELNNLAHVVADAIDRYSHEKDGCDRCEVNRRLEQVLVDFGVHFQEE